VADLMIALPEWQGLEMSFVQASEVARVMESEGKQNTHWHFNDCGCCVTVHSTDACWVIGRDGESTMFPGRGCQCGHDH